MTKAILVDADNRSIEMIEIKAGYESIKKMIGGKCKSLKIGEYLKNKDTLFLSLEEEKETKCFVLNGKVLKGNAVIVGSDSLGENIDVKSKIEELELSFLINEIPNQCNNQNMNIFI